MNTRFLTAQTRAITFTPNMINNVREAFRYRGPPRGWVYSEKIYSDRILVIPGIGRRNIVKSDGRIKDYHYDEIVELELAPSPELGRLVYDNLIDHIMTFLEDPYDGEPLIPQAGLSQTSRLDKARCWLGYKLIGQREREMSALEQASHLLRKHDTLISIIENVLFLIIKIYDAQHKRQIVLACLEFIKTFNSKALVNFSYSDTKANVIHCIEEIKFNMWSKHERGHSVGARIKNEIRKACKMETGVSTSTSTDTFSSEDTILEVTAQSGDTIEDDGNVVELMLKHYKVLRHSDFFKKVWKLVLYILSTCVCAGAKMDLSWQKFLGVYEEIKDLTILKGLDMTTSLIEAINFICTRGYQAFKTGSLDPIYHSGSSYEQWIQGVLDLKQVHINRKSGADKMSEHEFLGKLQKFLDQGKSMQRFANNLTAYEKKTLVDTRWTLVQIESEFLTRSELYKDRRKPKAIMFVSDSGCAKSTLQDMIIQFYANKYKLPIEGGFKYNVVPDQKFFDGISNDCWVMVVDDAAFKNPDKAQEGDNTVMTLLQIQNEVAFIANMAAVEDKGRVAPKPRLVVGSTNTDHLNLAQYYAHPFAAQRRLQHYVYLEIKEQYRNASGMLDSSKTNAGEFPDFWKFEVKVPIKVDSVSRNPKALGVMKTIFTTDDIREFLEWFNKVCDEHEHESDIIEESKTQFRKYCDEHNTFIALCGCEREIVTQNGHNCVFRSNYCKICLKSNICDHLLSGNNCVLCQAEVHTFELCNMYGGCSASLDSRHKYKAYKRVKNGVRWRYRCEDCQSEVEESTVTIADPDFYDKPFQPLRRVWCSWNAAYSGGKPPKYNTGEDHTVDVMVERELEQKKTYYTDLREQIKVALRYSRNMMCSATTKCINKFSEFALSSNSVISKGLDKASEFVEEISEDAKEKEKLAKSAIIRSGRKVMEKIGTDEFVQNLIIAVGVISTCALLCYISKYIYNLFTADQDEEVVEPQVGEPTEPRAPEATEEWRKDYIYNSTSDMICSYNISQPTQSRRNMDYKEFFTIVSKNCVRVIFHYVNEEGKMVHRTGFAFCVASHEYIFNAHAVPKTMYMLEINVDDVGTTITRDVKLSITYDEFKFDFEYDLAVLHVSNLPPKANLMKYFMREIGKATLDVDIVDYSQTITTGNRIKNCTLKEVEISGLGRKKVWGGLPRFGTVNGDCGQPYITMSGFGPMILGIHSAGNAQLAVAVALDINIISNLIRSDRVMTQTGTPNMIKDGKTILSSSIHMKSPLRYVMGNGEVYGSTSLPRSTMKSKVCETSIRKSMEKRGYTCEYTAPDLASKELKIKALQEIVQPNMLMSQKIVDKCVNAYVDHIKAKIPLQEIKDTVHLMDWDTVVNGADGVKFVDKMKRTTSAGFPYMQSKMYYLENKDGTYPLDPTKKLKLKDEIMENIEFMESQYKEGIACMSVYNACGKDEPRKPEKMPRIFFADNIEHIAIFRKYLLGFIRLMCNNQDVFRCGVGVVPQSLEWQNLYERLVKFGKKNLIEIDHKHFDKSMCAMIILAVFEIMGRICEYSGNYKQDALNVIAALGEDTAFPLIHYFGDLLRVLGLMPSGVPITANGNSIANTIYMMYAWEELILRCEMPRGITLKDYFDMTEGTFYGDDVLMAILEALKKYYNHTKIQEVLGEVGVIITMAQKDRESVATLDVDEVSFLKRKFREDKDIGAVVGPLDESSIIKMLMVCVRSKSVTPDYQALCSISSACREWFFHGKEKFLEKREELRQIIIENGLDEIAEPWVLPSWNELYNGFWLASWYNCGAVMPKPLPENDGDHASYCKTGSTNKVNPSLRRGVDQPDDSICDLQ